MSSLRNPTGMPQAGMMTNASAYNSKRPSTWNKVLRSISNYGMNYDGMIYRNQTGISRSQEITGAFGNFNLGPTGVAGSDSKYSSFASALATHIQEKRINYFDKSYPQMQRILVDYARKDRIREYVNIVSSEMIMYNQKTKMFCKPARLSTYNDEIQNKLNENFEYLATRFRFNNGIRAWHLAKKLLVEGYLAFEIVYDDKQRKIVDIIELNSHSLVKDIDPSTGEFLWIQYPEDPVNRRVFLDSQIIYISYSEALNEGEISYVENLIRPYNILSILEDSKIIWSITTATLYRQFILPLDGLSKAKMEEEMGKIISTYDDDIEIDSQYGFASINGQRTIPAYKDIWLPKSETGSPEISFIEPPALNLQDDTLLIYFKDKLELASMIPYGRLNRKETGGGNMFDNVAEVTREERDFGVFINRLRMIFKEVFIKPLWIQMLLDFPEYKDDFQFKSKIDVEFENDNQFEKWRLYSTLEKQAATITTLSGLKDANDKSAFSIRFLIEDLLELTTEQIERNKRYLAEDGLSAPAEGGGEGGGDEGGGLDLGGGGEESAGGEGGGDEGGEITL